MNTPFHYLIAHFVRRMFSSDDEGGSISLGIGAVLALLASPGALACFFLLEKYAHPRILLEGHRFDAYKQSANDEYFFIMLSMTITGLIMVLRWNRLLPDRRDFANLAALPISARDVFLANVIALVGLGLLFAIAVNGVSWFLYPAVVTFADGSLYGFLRVALSHAVAVFSSSLFTFFGVFAIVGVLMLVIPRRLFRSVSVCVRLVLVVAFVTELPSSPGANARRLPPAWFLGLYENIAGFASPAMAQLGHRALWALPAVICISMGAYSLCYGRHYLKLAESLDFIGSARHSFRMPLPAWFEAILFRSRFERACLSFALKTLLRSERHIMFFGGYLGIGLVLVVQSFHNVLAVPIMLSFFLISGLRFAFDIPAVLKANWLYRSSLEKPPTPLRAVGRKLALALTLPWQIFLLTPAMAYFFGWQVALTQTAVVVVLTILLAEFVFAKFHAIPFACSVQPDIQRFLSRILGSLFALLIAVPLLASSEGWMLHRPTRFIPAALVAAVLYLYLQSQKRSTLEVDQVLTFEDRAPSAFELLRLA